MSLKGNKLRPPSIQASDSPSSAISIVQASGRHSDSPSPSIKASDSAPPSTNTTKASTPSSSKNATPSVSPSNSVKIKKIRRTDSARTVNDVQPPESSSYPDPHAPQPRASTWGKQKVGGNGESSSKPSSRSSWKYVSWPSRLSMGKKAVTTASSTTSEADATSSGVSGNMDVEQSKSEPDKNKDVEGEGGEQQHEDSNELIAPEQVPLVAPEGEPEVRTNPSATEEEEPGPGDSTATLKPTSDVREDTTNGAEVTTAVTEEPPQSKPDHTPTVLERQRTSWGGWLWSYVPVPTSQHKATPQLEPIKEPEVIGRKEEASATSHSESSEAESEPTTQQQEPDQDAPTTSTPAAAVAAAPSLTTVPETAPTDTSQEVPAQPRPRSWWLWGAAAEPKDQAKEASTASTTSTSESAETATDTGTQALDDTITERQVALENSGIGAQSKAPEPVESSASSTNSANSSAGVIPSAPSSVQRSSAWAFWPISNRSTDSFKTAVSTVETNVKEATSVTKEGVISAVPGTMKLGKSKLKNEPPAPPPDAAVASNANASAVAQSVKKVDPQEGENSNAPAKKVQPPSPAKERLQKLQTKPAPPNHLLPAFESTYWKIEEPGVLGRIARVFKPPKPSEKHLYINTVKPRPKKAVAIGVHGFFPMKLVRTVLGEPTGTSKRFASHAASAIKRWAEREGIEVEVEAVALEGEGKVADRVEMLWKLLDKWMDHVKSADFIMVAAHSQGVVVGMKLLAKMIEEGCVDNARVGFLAMAGINLGPFYHLPQSVLTGSAKELFEFQRPDSLVSRKYIQSIRTVLAHKARICYIGSIDDQLVPMESSIFTNIHHPYIYRAVFVDGRIHAPDFLSHLVGFALKLRNLGISDHGLIRELSTPLAGSLYGGEGHSRIYDDGACYDLAVRHALETSECPEVALRVEPWTLPVATSNPYFLPWSMRGLIEEPFVRSELGAESKELLEEFDRWRPATKVLKDVKFRLEGIKMLELVKSKL